MTTAVQDRIEQARQLWAGKDLVEDRLRTARRALADVRHASENALTGAAVKVRRRPLAAVGGAAGVGLFVGAIFGFACGYLATRSRRFGS